MAIRFNRFLIMHFIIAQDEYISSEGNTTINFQEGNLNLAYDRKTKNGDFTVDLKSRSEVDLKIKGNGYFRIDSTNIKSINITKGLDVNGSFEIDFKSYDIEQIYINSIDLSNDADLTISKQSNSDIVHVNEVNVSAYSKPMISDFSIDSTLNIEQTALLTMDDINVEGADININYNNYDDPTPIIAGKFVHLPHSIKLKKADGSNKGPQKNKEYEIINGIFDYSHCNDWLGKLDFGDSGFDQKYCQKIYTNKANMLSDTIEVLIAKNTKSNKGGLSAGAIAGIVIAIIVVIAIVVVVVIIVLRRKNKNNGSSNENDEAKNENI